LHQTVITKVSITNLLSNQTSWDANRTTPFQFHLRPTDFDAWNCSLWAPSSQVESCPPDARRPLSRPQTPATQYLSQNKTIQWLLSPSSLELQRLRTATAKCTCTRTNATVRLVWILTENVFERSFRWHNPSLGRRDRDSGEQTTNLEKTEWPWKVFMCGVSTQQWPSTQINLLERTHQSAWLDAVTTPLTGSEWILVY